MTYKEALEYIHSVTWLGSRPGLERISDLCDRLGNPEDHCRFIHVAGTNGKGSTSVMLSSILRREGYTVGLFTSPYIEQFNERIRLNGENITDGDLAEVTAYVKTFADAMSDPPTEFELITAIAFEYFKRKNCDFVVLEAGLGGRLDSTNVIKGSVLSIITGIAFDHTAILGSTHAAIAAEKAGIIKAGCPVLCGECPPEAEEVIRDRADERGSPCYSTDFAKITNVSASLRGTTFDFDGQHIAIPLLGLYQTKNTAVVLTACRILRKEGIRISDDAVREGLMAAKWSARFEILRESPLVIYDGAHNVQGIGSAAENIRQYLSPLTKDGRVNILMGVMKDKEYSEMIGMLAPLSEKVYCVTPNNERSLSADREAAEYGAHGVSAIGFDSIEEGVFAACRDSLEERRPLICLGSLYMYADVKAAVSRWCEGEGR
ncbi:MAG: bifunctional folylpolyglutamate synthase/dihydrofolate synthase [Ruminococcaceae bacterium]|nr:bifunctional folylpolyglutamate synthase/dihydrofolate synthase [Oscillospiraceae bacterium]